MLSFKLTIFIYSDERLPTVFWGSFATDVMEAIQLHSNHAIICVIRFGKIKVWKGNFLIYNFSYLIYCVKIFLGPFIVHY